MHLWSAIIKHDNYHTESFFVEPTNVYIRYYGFSSGMFIVSASSCIFTCWQFNMGLVDLFMISSVVLVFGWPQCWLSYVKNWLPYWLHLKSAIQFFIVENYGDKSPAHFLFPLVLTFKIKYFTTAWHFILFFFVNKKTYSFYETPNHVWFT